MLEDQVSDSLGGFIAIHEWHIAVHENQVVTAIFPSRIHIFRNVFFYYIYSLLPT